MAGELNQLGQILQGLLGAGGKAIMGGAVGLDKNKGSVNKNPEANDQVKKLLESIIGVSMSGDREQLQQATEGTQQPTQQPTQPQGTSPLRPPTSPLRPPTLEQVVGKKKAEKHLGEQFDEGLKNGGNLNDMLRSVGLDETGNPVPQQGLPFSPEQIGQQLQGFAQSQQQQERFPQEQGPGLLKSLLTDFAQRMGAESTKAMADISNVKADTALKRQKLLNPDLTPREEAELKFEFDSKLETIKAGLKAGGVDALPVEASIKFSNIVTGNKALTDMAGILEANPDALLGSKVPGFLKSQAGRQLRTQMTTAFEMQLRATSGATIKEDEIKAKVKQFGASLLDSPETVRQKFTTLKGWFDTAINTADPDGIHRERASGIKQKTKDATKVFTPTPSGNSFKLVQ